MLHGGFIGLDAPFAWRPILIMIWFQHIKQKHYFAWRHVCRKDISATRGSLIYSGWKAPQSMRTLELVCFESVWLCCQLDIRCRIMFLLSLSPSQLPPGGLLLWSIWTKLHWPNFHSPFETEALELPCSWCHSLWTRWCGPSHIFHQVHQELEDMRIWARGG